MAYIYLRLAEVVAAVCLSLVHLDFSRDHDCSMSLLLMGHPNVWKKSCCSASHTFPPFVYQTPSHTHYSNVLHLSWLSRQSQCTHLVIWWQCTLLGGETHCSFYSCPTNTNISLSALHSCDLLWTVDWDSERYSDGSVTIVSNRSWMHIMDHWKVAITTGQIWSSTL